MILRTLIFFLLCFTLEIFHVSIVLADDQTDSSIREPSEIVTLDSLFSELEQAGSLAEAEQVEQMIWKRWHQHKIPSISQELWLGTRYLQENNFKKALFVFDRIIEKAPAFSEAFNKRATTYFLMKKYDKSLMDIKVTLTLEPRHFGALSGMGLIFMKLGDYQRAFVAFTKVLKIYPLSSSARANIKVIERELNLKVL
tara:strand:- start:565 stop:1158 length:594 start_codon:yes stop_codon:yes gene_type:complete